MSRLLITYASAHGTVAKIAERIARDIEAHGHEVKMLALDRRHEAVSTAGFDGWILAASVHVGAYAKCVRKFAQQHAADFAGKPTAFVSVSLGMIPGNTETERAETKAIAEKFVADVGWKPAVIEHVAGSLMYRRYNFILRFFVKQMMKQTHHETDTSRNHEYTDWKAVDEFASVFANRLATNAA